METLYQTNQTQNFQILCPTDTQICFDHQKKLELVCLQNDCDSKGLLCTECINSHINHQVISYTKYQKEITRKAKQLISDYIFIQNQKRQLINELKRKFQQTRQELDQIFEQINSDKTKETNDMQNLLRIKFASLRECQYLLSQNSKMSSQKLNDKFIVSLQHLSKNLSQDHDLKLDEQYYEAIQQQINYNLEMRKSLDSQRDEDISWFNKKIQQFMKDNMIIKEDIELEISPSPI